VDEFYVDPQDRVAMRTKLDQEGIVHAYPTMQRRYDGEIIWIEGYTRKIRNGNESTTLEGAIVNITERRQTEQSLIESEKRLSAAASCTSDLIWETDHDRGSLEWFGDIDSALGYAPGEFPRTIEAWMAAIHPEDQDSVNRSLEKSLKSGKNYSAEYRIKKKDGSYLFWQDSGTTTLTRDGEIIQSVGAITDITERKEAELALRQSEEDLKIAQAIANVGSYSWDLRADRVTWSDEMKRLLWCKDEMPTYEFFLSRIHPDDRDYIIATGQKLQQGSDPTELEYRLMGPDGTVRWVRDRIQVKTDEEGRPISMLGTSQDITERKIAEEALQKSEARFRAIVEDQTEMIVRWKPDGVRTFVNESYCRFFDTPEDEIIGTSFYPLILEEDLIAVKERINRLSVEEPVSTDEHRVHLPDGTMGWQEWTDRAFFDEHGAVVELQSVGRDITERKLADEALRRSEELLKETGQLANTGGWSLDLITMEPYFTEETYRIYGLPPTAPPKPEDGIKFYAPEARPLIQQAVNEAIENGTPYDLELPFASAKGEHLWVRTMGQVQYEGKKAVRLFGAIQDITERKQAEEQIRLQASALNAAANGIMITQKDGEIIWANPAMETLSGYSVDEIIGQTPDIFRSGKQTESYYEKMAEVLLQRDVWRSEMSNRRKDGSLYIEDQVIAPVQNDSGEITHYVSIKQDITERKQADDALRDSETRLHAIFDHHYQLTGLLDREGRLLAANRTALEFIGGDESDVLGHYFWDTPWWEPSQESEVRSAIERASKGEFVRFETTEINANGEARNMDFSLSPIQDDDGNVIYLVPEGRDITARKQSEKALHSYANRLEILHEIDQGILAAQSIGEISSIAASGLRKLIPCQRISITLFDAASKMLEFIAVDTDIDTGYDVGDQLSLEEYQDQLTALRNDRVVIDQDEGDNYPGGLRAFVHVPLTAGGDLIGEINLGTVDLNTITEDHYQIAGQVADQLAIAIQQARLTEAETQRRQEAETLAMTTAALTQTLELDSVLDAILTYLERVLPYDSCTVFLLESETLFGVAARGLVNASNVIDYRFPLTDKLFSEIRQKRSPIILENAQTDPRFESWGDTTYVRGWMGIPLIVRDDVIGFITIDSKRINAYGEREAALAQAFANQAAIAIQNARLLDQTKQHAQELELRVADQTRELTTLFDISSMASQSLDLESLLPKVLDQVLLALDSSVGGIHILDDDLQSLLLVCQKQLIHRIKNAAEIVPLGRGMLGQIMRSGEPLHSVNITKDSRAFFNFEDELAYFGVPLKAGGRSFGVISVLRDSSKGEPDYTGEEKALIVSIAEQVGAVIESARLRDQAEQAAVLEERQRLARDLHDAVSQTLFSASVIAQTLDRLWERDPDLVRQNLVELQRLTQGALAEMRNLLLELRPAALEHTAMVELLGQLADGFIGRTQTAIEITITGKDPLPFEIRATFFRMVQEALNNIIKHARAQRVWVHYDSQGSQAHITIEDDGRGFDLDKQPPGHHGLTIMQERADSIAAELAVTSQPGEGTKIDIQWRAESETS